MNRRDDEFDRFRGDAIYEAYRRGLDVDRVDYDRVEQDFYDGRSESAEAERLARWDEQRRQEQYESELQEQYESELQEQYEREQKELYQEELRRQQLDGEQ